MKKRQKIYLSDVAELAGVSSSAAGKVLNGGSDQIRVSPETRRRIEAAARKLGYTRNIAASILAGGRSRLIGVFVDSFTPYRGLRLLQEIERACTRTGYRIMTSFSHDCIADMKEDYLTFRHYGITDFICCAHDYPDSRDEIRSLFADAENVVFMEKPCLENVPFVRTSRLQALTDMIADARAKGFRRFGILHAPQVNASERVLRGEFRRALRANGLEPDEKLFFEYPEDPADPVPRIQLTMKKMIRRQKPDFLYVDDAGHAAALRTQLEGSDLKIRIYGGNNDPFFNCIGVDSFDPCYDKIAAALLDLLLHPESRGDAPHVIESVYKKRYEV